jgi:hypothetical protein
MFYFHELLLPHIAANVSPSKNFRCSESRKEKTFPVALQAVKAAFKNEF